MLKNKRGITLVALVVTIIILLILAGVSINFIFGNEGIFNKTQIAAEKYKKSAAEENEIVFNIVDTMDQYGTNSKINAEAVSFSPEDSNWKVKNVKEALDYLYNN